LSTKAQTTASGSTRSSQFKYGFSGAEPEKIDPSRTVMVVAAEKAAGKSYFFQSNPDAFIINADLKPLSYRKDGQPHSEALVWPLRINGKNYSAPGVEMGELTWDDVLEVKNHIIEMAGKPGSPKMVVLDTITALRALVMRWLPGQYKKPSFEALGEKGWARINSEIANLVDDFEVAGLGVAMCFHVRRLFLKQGGSGDRPTGPGQAVDKVLYQLDTSAGQWSALQAKPSIVVGLIREFKSRRQPDGQFKKIPVTTMDIGVSGRFDDCFGSMHILPETIELPAESPWSHFVTVFKENN
jgi:hypothetical protein